MTTDTAEPWTITEHCPATPGGRCDLTPIGRFFDKSGIVGEVSVERCRNCGVGVSRPPIADVAFLYADRASSDFQPGTGGLSRAIKRIAFRAQARKLLSQVDGAPARVIDFACGSGLFTACLAEVLPSGSVTGTDFHSAPPPDLGDVAYRSIGDLAALRGSADLLLAMHVIEHDDDPKRLLNSMIDLVRPGGSLVIEAPNVDCVWAPVFSRYWDSWYLPYHRVHFSRASLRALVQACGLEVVREIDISIPTMGRTIANLLKRANSTPFILLSAALNPLQIAVERLTRRPSALRLIARKPAS